MTIEKSDQSALLPASEGRHDALAATVPAVRLFDATERAAISLAYVDSLGSLRPPIRVPRFLRPLFPRFVRSLADARLEALRRVAVAFRSGRQDVERVEIEAALAAGYSRGQLFALRRQLLFRADVRASAIAHAPA